MAVHSCPMRILFLHSNIPNYVTDGLLHGLREVLGNAVVDVPRNDVMYRDAIPELLDKTGNGGKILYAKLEDADELRTARCFWQRELADYDYVLFADIDRQADLFHTLYRQLGPTVAQDKLIIIDGYDAAQVFPYFKMRWRLRTKWWTFLHPYHRVRYFKRERLDRSAGGLWASFYRWLERRYRLYTITMSIPDEYIEDVPMEEKDQDFPNYLVDGEVARMLGQADAFNPTGKRQFKFPDEQSYLTDVRRSRYGITTKRAGWDCLRHYEYAAKGVVLCFRDLGEKDAKCAPVGLGKRNTIVYSNADDLRGKLDKIRPEEFDQMRKEILEWVKSYTTRSVVQRWLGELRHSQRII